MIRGNGSPRIVVREPNRTALVLVVEESLEVGRECAGLLLRDGSISRRHLLVEPEAGRVCVTDLDSRNGSTINRRPLRPRQRLDVGDTVHFGACTLTPLAAGGGGRTSERRGEVRDARVGTSLERGVAASGGAIVSAIAGEPGICVVVVGEVCDEPERRRDQGSARWRKALEVHRLLVHGMVQRHGGAKAWSRGDGFIICFRNATTAMGFSLDVQGATASYGSANPQLGVRVRMAIDLVDGESFRARAEATVDGDELRSVRLCQAARAGETLVSMPVHDVVRNGNAHFGPPKIARFAELGDQYTFFELRSSDHS